MSKKAKKTETEAQIRTTEVCSAVHQLIIDYEQTKQLPIGKAVRSDVFSVGGHCWRIECYPRGTHEEDGGEYLSLFLKHMSRTSRVKAIFEAFLMDKHGEPCTMATRRSCVHDFLINKDGESNDDGVDWGWSQFIKGTTLGTNNNYVKDAHITFVCGIMVIHASPIPVPPPDIGIHLGRLLDRTEGMDVSMCHSPLTARHSVLVVQCLLPVHQSSERSSSAPWPRPQCHPTLHEITPATFKVMLRFIYTDVLPEDELGDSSTEILQDLLAAADRYALDRLKLMCAQKLWGKLSTDTVATTLACAETYNCQELKSKCIDFLAVEENFKEAAFTDGYALLVLTPISYC